MESVLESEIEAAIAQCQEHHSALSKQICPEVACDAMCYTAIRTALCFSNNKTASTAHLLEIISMAVRHDTEANEHPESNENSIDFYRQEAPDAKH